MKDPVDPSLKNTHDTLKLFYTVILTIAISEGLLKFVNTPEGVIRPFSSFTIQELVILGVFLLLIGRFFLGGVRHLDATYIEQPRDQIGGNVSLFVGMDMLLLATDALILLYIGSSIREIESFFVGIILLLFVDSVWSLLIVFVYHSVRVGGNFSPEFIWGVNNLLHFFVFVLAFGLAIQVLNVQTISSIWPYLALIALSNSIFDFGLTWEFYFPY